MKSFSLSIYPITEYLVHYFDALFTMLLFSSSISSIRLPEFSLFFFFPSSCLEIIYSISMLLMLPLKF